jgi:large repetitive protein
MVKQRLLIALILAMFSFLELSAQKQVIYYVPLPDNDFHGAIKTVNNNAASNDLNSVVSITTSQNGAIVTYDHWEDGYEVDINHPVQTTTQIWGDGNTANGNASTILGCNCAGDILTSGDVITLKTLNVIPRSTGIVAYDGRDKIASNRKLSVSRAGWCTSPGTILAGAVEVLDTSTYDTFFQMPIGADIANAVDRDMFQRTEMQVIASQNSTSVEVDKNVDGIVDQTFTLNEGESMRVTGTINVGATVTSNKPIAVIAHGSDPLSTLQNRWFQVFATDLWEQNYYSPVSSNSSAAPSASFIFNGSASSITVDYTTRTTSGTLTVAANSVVRHDLPLGEGAKYTSLSDFLALGANDVDATNRSNWDWGFTLLPESYLSQSASVGWGPGSSDLSSNGSPLWAIAIYNTTIYADYDGDPTTGDEIDPRGNKCDSSIVVSAYQVVRFYDYTDKNQSGMHVYTTDGTQVVVAWGEDGAVAGASSPFLDMGTIASPTKDIDFKKTASLHFDQDSDGKADAGDTIKYKLILNSYSLRSDEIVQLTDTLSNNLEYIANSAVRKSSDVLLNGAIADAGATPFPFDEAGFSLPSLFGHQFDTLEFLVKVLPLSQTSIFNSVTILFDEGDTYIATSSTSADTKPTATFDTVALNEDDAASTIFVCSNDDFNADGPATAAITITTMPLHGIASVNDNGTATDPTDDRIIYTPTANYNGVDTVIYQICDSNGDCDTAYVAISIASVDDAPLAARDDISTNEDVAVSIPVVTSNDNFGGDGASTTTITITQAPVNGIASVDNNGTPNNPIDDKILYTPNANVSGSDSLIYEICDIDGDCDTAVVIITINSVDDLPVANTEGVVLAEDDAATTIIVTSNDDFGGDGASITDITITQAPVNGIASVNDNGTPNNPIDDRISYTPTANYNGLDSIIYRIQDIDGDFDTAIVHITIQSVNDLPLAQRDNASTNEDTSVEIAVVTSNDNFGGDGANATSITLTQLPNLGSATIDDNGTPSNPTDDKIDYTPASNVSGLDSLIYQICDINGDCDTAIVYITVNAVNDPIVAERNDDFTNEDVAKTITVLGNDFDTEGVNVASVTIDEAPKHGTAVANPDGTILYTPTADYFGNDTLVYRVCDNGSPATCDTALLVIVVNSVNDLPLANVDGLVVSQDAPATTVNVTSNDNFGGDGSNNVAITVTTAPTRGIASVDDNGTPANPTDDKVVFTPTAGFNGIDSLIYRIEDANGDFDTAIVHITINAVNSLPVANTEGVVVLEDALATTINVITNDNFGGDGASATAITITQAPVNGIASVDNNGTPTNPTDDKLIYTPTANVNGIDSIIYRIEDANGDFDTAIVHITIQSVDDLPVAIRDDISTNENITANIPVITSNDNFGGDGASTAAITITQAATKGSATVDDNGTPTNPTDDKIIFVPTTNVFGLDSLIYEICDIDGDCDTAIVYINIIEINDQIVANRDNLILNEDTSLGLNVVGNDTDTEGVDATSVTITEAAKHGTTAIHPTTGVITYTPNLNYNGKDTLVYRICDNGGMATCDTALVVITIVPVNDAPVANREDVSTTKNTLINITVLPNDTDVDNNINLTSVFVTETPSNGNFVENPDGTISYMPDAGFVGLDTLIYEICDLGSPVLCDTALVVITVNNVNDLPVANRNNATINEDATVLIAVLGNDNFGGDGASNSAITITQMPNKGVATVNNNGTPTNPADDRINYVPTLNANGADTLIYQICDSNGDCDTALVVFDITPINDEPSVNREDIATLMNTAIPITILSNDSDVDGGIDTTTLTIDTAPKNGITNINFTTGVITYTPNSGFIGLDTLIYRVCDTGTPLPAQCDTAIVVINVTGLPNNAPVANREDVSVIEDGSLTMGVLGNDTDTDGALVPSTVTVTRAPAHGTATPNPDGSITYTPTGNYAGADTLIYQVCDNGTPALCDTALVVITVNPSNDAPTANGEIVATLMDTAIPISVVDNDTDTDGAIDATTVTIDTAPKNGTTGINPTTGVITYTPNSGFTGLDTLIYRVCDTGIPLPAQCDTAIVVINVTAVANNAPIANRNDIPVTEDTPLTFNVLGNDTDTEGGIVPSTVTITKAPANGTATPNPDGTITFTPTGNYAGVDTLIYQVCDNGMPALCDTALVILNISPVNDAPLANREDVTTAINTALPINVVSNDSDADGGVDATSVTIDTAPKNGTTGINPTTGVITYTPNTGFTGLDTLIYRVCDTGTPLPAQCDTAIVVITVTGTPNTAPVANRDDVSTVQNSAIPIGVLDNDTDVENNINPLSVTIPQAPANGMTSINPLNGAITYTPNTGFAGKDTLIYQVCDGGTPALCDTALVVITVNAVNTLPIADRDDMSTNEDATLTFNVTGNDNFNGDGPSNTPITITKLPSKGTATVNDNGTPTNPADDRINFVPALNANGLDTLIYQICDSNGDCDTALLVINIVPVNDKPIANEDATSTPINTAINITVMTNDSDVENGLVANSVFVTELPNNGNTVDNPDGTITYTPNTGFIGTDTLVYEICDNGSPALCDTAYVIITVTGTPNNAPVANREDVSVIEDGSLTMGVLGNDTDTEGGLVPSTVTVTRAPAHGIATPNPDGTITYTPTGNYAGPDTLIYQVCDNGTPALCDTALVVITVNPVNDAPIANGETVATLMDTAIPISVVNNDTDTDGAIDATTVTIDTAPKNGMTGINPTTGVITYTPNSGFTGLDTLIYRVCDTGTPTPAQCDTAIVVINVTAVANNAPVANRNDISVTEDTPLTFNVLGNDTDTDGGIVPSTVTITKAPANGTATPNPDGTITYTPTGNYSGVDTLIYQVCDNGIPALCDTALVILTISPVNDAPLANRDDVTTAINTALPINVVSNDSDTDGGIDATTVTIDTAPKNGTTSVNPTTGVITYTPNSGFTGKDTLIYRVCDTGTPLPAQCDTAIVVITVTGTPNTAPVANRDDVSTVQNSAIPIGVLDNDTDIESNINPASVVVTKQPTNGITVVNPLNGAVTYTPSTGFAGKDTLIYQVCDSGTPALCDTALVVITVNATNTLPIADRDDVSTNEDITAIFNVTVNDNFNGDGPSATPITITKLPSKGTATVNDNGTPTNPTDDKIDFVPALNANGLDTLIYQICDSNGDCDTALLVINIVPVNDKPVANEDATSTPINTAINITVITNDSDVENGLVANSVFVTELPNNGNATNNPDGTITYTPNTGFVGVDTLVYEICDNGSPALCDTAYVIVTVTGAPNNAPVANRNDIPVTEDTPLTFNVLANDTDTEGGIVPSTVTITRAPAHGIASKNPDGTINYTPTLNYAGLDTLIYQVCDNGTPALCDTALVVLTISPINDAPTANRNDVLTAKNTMVTSNVLANDSDIDGAIDPTTLAVIENPKSGTYIINPDKTITYTPLNNFTGSDTLVYRVCDTGTPLPAQCDTALVVFTVTGTNDAPFANTDVVSIDEDTPLIISVLDNDTDTEGVSPTTVTVTSQPKNGTATPNINGTITYIPNPNFAGVDTLIYQVCDLGTPTLCDTAMVIVTVNPINDPLVANRNDATTVKNTLVNISILTNDIDVDGGIDTASLTLFTAPNSGSAVFNPDGTLTYTPNTDFVGKDTLVYRVCDKGSPTPVTCDTAIVVITVNGVNGTPVATRDDIATQQDVNVRINVTVNDNFGTDGASTTAITIIKSPTNGTANVVTNFSPNDPSDDLIDYTPNAGFVGQDTLIYEICDGNGDCDTALVVITINSNVNNAPVANRDNVSTIKNEVLVINILGNDTDNSALDTASITIIEPARNGIALINTDGTITYTPNQNFVGKDTLIYNVCDKGTPAQCDTAIVVITVKEQNLPPIAQNDTTTTESGVAVSGTVATNDSDVDDTNDNLFFTMIDAVKNTEGVLVFNPNGSYTFTPEQGYKDTLRVKYSVCDPVGNCDTATLVIIVTEAICRDIIAAKTIIANNICNVGDICLSLPIADTLNYSILLNNDVYQGEFKECANGGTSITVGVGTYQLIIGSNHIVCEDTVQIIATCNPILSDTVSVTLQLGKVDTVCMNTTNLTGTNYTINLACAGSDSATFEVLQGTACIELKTTKLGLDTICLKICDENNNCDTTYVIIDGRLDIKDVADDSITSTINTPVLIDVVSNDNAANGAGSVGVSILTPPNHGTATVEADGRVKYTPEQDYCSSTPDSMTYVLCTNKGCDTAMIRVTILCDDIIIYNGFSPNGDGINDFFVIEGLEKYPDHNLCVFNRWGNKVLDVKEYKNDWSGSWSNQTLPDGTYYYVLNKGDGKVVYGYVQIHR